MNDIKFAKLHAGEKFYFTGEEVKVVGYDSVGWGVSNCRRFSMGWSVDALSLGDVILIPPVNDKTVKYWYVSEYDLDRAEDRKAYAYSNYRETRNRKVTNGGTCIEGLLSTDN